MIADFDGDGAADIASADAASNTVSILRGNGKGGFERPRSFPALEVPHLLVAADVNRDGKPDLVVTAHDSNDAVLLVNGGTSFQRRVITIFRDTKPHNHGLAMGDMNGDGNVDLTFGQQDLSQIAILLGDGRGGFRPAAGSPVATGRDPYPHVLTDVNGDGKLDLVVPAVRGNEINILLGRGDGTFSAAGAASTGIARPYFVTVADFSRDGRVDLVVAHDDTSRVAILLGEGRGSFRQAPGSPVDAGQRGWVIAAADVNGDGRLDGAISGGRVIQLLQGDGTGRLTVGAQLPLAGNTWQIKAADVNGDGKIDLIVPAPDRDSIQVFLAR